MNPPVSPVILVTGASGFVGSAICLEIKSSHPQYQIIAVTRSVSRTAALRRLGVDEVLTSVTTDPAKAILSRVTHVVHAAANARFKSGADYEAENVAPLRELLEVLPKSSLKRFVFISSIGAVDRLPSDPSMEPLTDASPPAPTSKYGQSKLTGEKIVRESAFDYCIVRPPWVYGPGMRLDSHLAVFLAAGIRGSLLSRLNLCGEASVIHVEDLARAILKALFEPTLSKKTVFVSEEVPVRIGEVLSFARGSSGRGTFQIGFPTFLQNFLTAIPKLVPFAAKVSLQKALTCTNTLGGLSDWTPRLSWESARTALYEYVRQPPGLTVITGAASGLGRELARELAARGHKLVLVDRSVEVESLAKELNAHYLVIDLSADGSVELFVAKLGQLAAPVRGVVHVAGYGIRSNFDSTNYDDIERIFRTNTLFPIQSTNRLLPELTQLPGSFLIFVCSSIATAPLPGMPLYGATKAALYSFARSLSAELLNRSPQVLVVLPSGMKTKFQEASGVKVLQSGKGLLDPRVVAVKIVQAFEGRKSVLKVGFVGNLIPWVTGLMPQGLQLRLWSALMRKLR